MAMLVLLLLVPLLASQHGGPRDPAPCCLQRMVGLVHDFLPWAPEKGWSRSRPLTAAGTQADSAPPAAPVTLQGARPELPQCSYAWPPGSSDARRASRNPTWLCLVASIAAACMHNLASALGTGAMGLQGNDSRVTNLDVVTRPHTARLYKPYRSSFSSSLAADAGSELTRAATA